MTENVVGDKVPEVPAASANILMASTPKKKSSGTRRPNAEAKARERQNQIERLLISEYGITHAQLARRFKVSPRTIERDMVPIHKRFMEKMAGTGEVDTLLKETMDSLDHNIAALENMCATAVGNEDLRTANAIRRNIAQTQEIKLNMLTKLGVRKEAPMQIDSRIEFKWAT